MQPGGIEPAPRQHMVHQIAMDSSVTVFERMDVDKPEREHRCGNNRVEIVFRGMIEGDQSRHQRGDIFMSRVDMIGTRPLRIAVMLTNKSAFLPESQLHKTLVAD